MIPESPSLASILIMEHSTNPSTTEGAGPQSAQHRLLQRSHYWQTIKHVLPLSLRRISSEAFQTSSHLKHGTERRDTATAAREFQQLQRKLQALMNSIMDKPMMLSCRLTTQKHMWPAAQMGSRLSASATQITHHLLQQSTHPATPTESFFQVTETPLMSPTPLLVAFRS